MDDLISRSAVLEILTNNIVIHEDEIDLMEEVCHTIKVAPAIDAVPVVHARWIPIKLYGEDHAIKCSACNNCDNPSKVPGRYCWHCGARMDGEENEC